MTNEHDGRCLSDLELDRYNAMQVEELQVARIRGHLETCAECRLRNEALIQAHEQILRRLREGGSA